MTPWFIALALARSLDVSSTCMALHRGAYEINPMLPQTCGAQIGVHAGIGLAQILLIHKVSATHPRLAKVIGAVSISVELGATFSNVRTLQGMR